MQEARKAVIKDGWVVCSKCGHKLGRAVGDTPPSGIEIKCHSCKSINLVNKGRTDTVRQRKRKRLYITPHYKHCKPYDPNVEE